MPLPHCPTQRAAILCVLLPTLALSAWRPTNGPYGKTIEDLASDGSTAYAATQEGVFRSDDSGAAWHAIPRGLAPAPDPGNRIATYSLAARGRLAWVGYDRGVWRYDALADKWTRTTKGLEDTVITRLAIAGDTLWAGSWQGGIFRSTDNGARWTRRHSAETPILGLAAAGGCAFAVTEAGLQRSNARGEAWAPVGNGLSAGRAKAVAANAEFVFALVDSGIFRTGDQGGTWTRVSPPGGHAYGLQFLGAEGPTLFTNSPRVFWISPDHGATWRKDTLAFRPLADLSAETFASAGSVLFAGCQWGLLRSRDAGVTWEPANLGLAGDGVDDMATLADGSLLAARRDQFVTVDTGRTWQPRPPIGEPVPRGVSRVFPYGGSIYFGTQTGGVYRSDDGGLTARHYKGDWPQVTVTAFVPHAGDLFLAAGHNRVLRIPKAGDTLVSAVRGLGPDASTASLAECDGILFAGTGAGIYRFNDSTQVWTKSGVGRIGDQVEVSLFGTAGILLAGTWGDGIHRSKDKGATWKRVSRVSGATRFLRIGGAIFAATGKGVSLSTDMGATWKDVGGGAFPAGAISLHAYADRLWAGTLEHGVFYREFSELGIPRVGPAQNGTRAR